MRKSYKFFGLSVLALATAISVSAVSQRMISIRCLLCEGTIYRLSAIEYSRWPAKEVPCFHGPCHKFVCESYAPNCDMTIGQWCEVRGYTPRSKEIAGHTWHALINREYKIKEND